MTNPIIKPTVGRVVWFHPSELTGEAAFARHKDGQPYAAIIARVFDFDALVNLTVFDANGNAHSRTSVPLVQDGASVPGSGYYCEWMPYQKGQAAKTEAAEKDAAEAQPAYRQRTQREELEYNLVAGAASHLAQVPSRAREIAQGIKVVLDELHPSELSPDTRALERQFERKPTALPVIDPGPDSLERAHAEAHASAVLYPAIKAAMEELQTLHPGFNDAVNRAFNLLHDAFWSECPAPAGASPRRSVGEAAPDFLTGKTACSMAGEGACEACQ